MSKVKEDEGSEFIPLCCVCGREGCKECLRKDALSGEVLMICRSCKEDRGDEDEEDELQG
jgi:hypothetical protein